MEMQERPRIQCLDHGYVILVDSMGDDTAIVEGARVSYDQLEIAGTDPARDAKLIRYLIMNRHTNPLEQVVLKFQVKAPIFVFRQWHRHRTWSYNEMSARYTELPEDFYVPRVEDVGVQAKSSKQARDREENSHAEHVRETIANFCHGAFDVYRHLLDSDCPRELARGILPLNSVASARRDQSRDGRHARGPAGGA